MLITILSVLLIWSVVGGAIGIYDCDNEHDRKPDLLWFAIYGPSLWAALAALFVVHFYLEGIKYLERKLRK